MADHVTTETHGAVRVIRIDRAEAMNALTGAMFHAMRDAFAEAGRDPAIRAVLFCSTGKAFSVGADLRDPMLGFDLPPEEKADACRATLGGLMNGLISDIAACPRPVVTAINGTCAGGGVGLALAGDLAVMGDGARLMLGFVPVLALTPDLGATWQLTRKLGRSRALGLMITGRPIPAKMAQDLGLVWEVAPDDDLFDAALALATELAEGPTNAQMTLRSLVDSAEINDLTAQLAAECEAQASRSNDPEVAEAVAAFMAKRPPDFSKL